MKRFFFIFLFPVILFAGSFEPNSLDRQIIDHTFNEEFDRAFKLSQDQIKALPGSPKYYYYYINARILEYYQRIAEMDPARRDAGRKALNKEIIDYCEVVIEKFEDSKFNTENKFYYGSIYAYLGRIYGIDGSWWSAFKSGMKAKNIMEEILQSDPQFYDAYLVLGMLHYYADRLSGVTGFIAGVLGMSGDRDKGLAYLNSAYEKGKLTYGQTALTLIEVYSSLEDNDAASIKYFEEFLKKFPKSKRTLNSYCQRLLNLNEFGKVESLINSDDQNLIEEYTKARYYDATGKSDLAIKHAINSLENEKPTWRGAVGNAKYIIVTNAWLTGNSSLLKKYEPELDERYKESFSTMRRYEKESRWLHRFAVEIASGKSISELEKSAAARPDLSKAEDLERRFNLIFGFVYFKKNQFNKAEQYYRQALRSGDEREKYTAYKYLVDIYMKQTADRNKVKQLLDEIDDLENDRLTFRAKDLEKKYNL